MYISNLLFVFTLLKSRYKSSSQVVFPFTILFVLLFEIAIIIFLRQSCSC